jgi:hypothetical protein
MDVAELSKIKIQLDDLVQNPRLWPVKDDQSGLLLLALQTERDLHYVTAVRTLVDSYRVLIQWAAQRDPLSAHDKKLIALSRSSFESAVAVLQADTWSKYSKVAKSMAKSLASIFQVEFLFVIPNAISDIKDLLDLPLAEFESQNKLLPAIESSMELMLLMAMFVQSQVRAITGTASEVELSDVNNLKRPIVNTLLELKHKVPAGADALSARLTFSEEGFWPAGLRGPINVASFTQP